MFNIGVFVIMMRKGSDYCRVFVVWLRIVPTNLFVTAINGITVALYAADFEIQGNTERFPRLW